MYCVFFLCVIAGLATCEVCVQDTTSCANEVCSVNMVPTCDMGFCTCIDTPNQNGCSVVADCDRMNYWEQHHCGRPHRLCTAGKCSCSQHGK